MIDRLLTAVRALLPKQRRGVLPPPTPDWRATIRRRVLTVAVLVGVWAVGIEARLVYLQIIGRADLMARADRESQTRRVLLAPRGDILDRNGRKLATSAMADSVIANPSDVANAAEAVNQLCSIFGDCTAKERRTLIARLSTKQSFAYVRKHVTADQARRVVDLKLKGIRTDKEPQRYYPNSELAAAVIGFVGAEHKGLSGIEWAYDSRIRGTDGQVLLLKDAKQQSYDRAERPPTPGATIELTLDAHLQHIAERELETAIEEHRPESGVVVILDPSSGEILAMASRPTFNPNAFEKFSDNERRNRAVQDTYEPGSTFKAVTASAAIEERLMPISTLINTDPGIIRIGNRVIDEYQGHHYGVLSFTDVIVKSSNVGAVKIGLQVGTDRLSKYVELYGFGRPVSPDFLSENPGIVWKKEQWTESALASVSMGYQVAVTPLQVISAFSAIGNRGVYMEPRVVKAISDANGRRVVTPKILRRVVSEETASTLTTIMEQVVERGTAKAAQIPGFTIAGKTGTAEKLINGRYSKTNNYASFAGFVPSRDPKLAILVMLDSPRTGGTSGGVAAAPAFRRIAEEALRYLRVAPTINAAPPVLMARSTPLHESSAVFVPVTNEIEPGKVPDVRGMSGREASQLLTKVGLKTRIEGRGFVVSQEPLAGSPARPGSTCRLVLAMKPVSTPGAQR